MSLPNLYAILGVEPTVGREELTRAYLRRLQQWHPENYSKPDAAELFTAAKYAYKFLSCPLSRASFDTMLALAKASVGSRTSRSDVAELSCMTEAVLASHGWLVKE